jgi:hypothetical protein
MVYCDGVAEIISISEFHIKNSAGVWFHPMNGSKI